MSTDPRDWGADEATCKRHKEWLSLVDPIQAFYHSWSVGLEGWAAALAERRRLLNLLSDRHPEAESVVAALNEKVEELLATVTEDGMRFARSNLNLRNELTAKNVEIKRLNDCLDGRY